MRFCYLQSKVPMPLKYEARKYIILASWLNNPLTTFLNPQLSWSSLPFTAIQHP